MPIDLAPFHAAQFLDEQALLPPQPACPFGGAVERVPVVVLQRDPDVMLLQCTQCGAASASRMPTDHALETYYRGYYSTPAFSRMTRGSSTATSTTFADWAPTSPARQADT